jgi:hypothetical protein|eukprot:COSAG04_NODE_5356_length_1642_cov_4.534176_3_plen_50_part_00
MLLTLRLGVCRPNLSPDKRYFFSVYYNISWLKHTDTFTGPNCEQLKAWA